MTIIVSSHILSGSSRITRPICWCCAAGGWWSSARWARPPTMRGRGHASPGPPRRPARSAAAGRALGRPADGRRARWRSSNSPAIRRSAPCCCGAVRSPRSCPFRRFRGRARELQYLPHERRRGAGEDAMNPELRRNLWLEFSLTRLLLAPVAIQALLTLTWIVSGFSRGGRRGGWGDVLPIGRPPGTRRAADLVAEEIAGGTWDGQRMFRTRRLADELGKLLGHAMSVMPRVSPSSRSSAAIGQRHTALAKRPGHPVVAPWDGRSGPGRCHAGEPGPAAPPRHPPAPRRSPARSPAFWAWWRPGSSMAGSAALSARHRRARPGWYGELFSLAARASGEASGIYRLMRVKSISTWLGWLALPCS